MATITKTSNSIARIRTYARSNASVPYLTIKDAIPEELTYGLSHEGVPQQSVCGLVYDTNNQKFIAFIRK
jgi:hypothetical protein